MHTLETIAPQFQVEALRSTHWPDFAGLGFSYHQLLAAESLWAQRSGQVSAANETRAIALITLLFFHRDQGNCCLPVEQIPQLWQERIDSTESKTHKLRNAIVWPQTIDMLHELASLRLAQNVGAEDNPELPLALSLLSNSGGTWLYLTSDWKRELALARHIRRINQDLPVSPQQLHELEQCLAALPPGKQLDTTQKQAVVSGLSKRFYILTGGPGTGKTTTVFHLLRAKFHAFACENHSTPNIALCAPTGRAAARLSESLKNSLALIQHGSTLPSDKDFADFIGQCDGMTLHRLLGLSGSFKRQKPETTLPYDIIVVDEASMLDLPLMGGLCERLADQAHLILVGDQNQLPAIESGEILAQLASVAPLVPIGITALETVYRSNRAIIDCAKQILAGSSEGALQTMRDNPGTIELEILPANPGLEMALHRSVRQWFSDLKLADLAKQCGQVNLDHGTTEIENLFQRISSAVMLSPRHLGLGGTEHLNNVVAGFLQAQGVSTTFQRQAFYPGQMVMVTRNDYERGLFNGDRGLVFRSAGRLAVFFPGSAQGQKLFPVPNSISGLEPAFAISIHKSQGSEYQRVDLYLTDHKTPETVVGRELLYTGITRAKSQLRLYIHPDGFSQACATQGKRWSNLGPLLSSDLTGS